MDKIITIEKKWEFYCYTASDKKSGKFLAKWKDLQDDSYHESDRLINSEKEALAAAEIGANHTCGFKYKQEANPEMDALMDLIYGKKKKE